MGEKPNLKKITKVGQGLVIFLTKETKELNWKEGDYVSVRVDKQNGTILLKLVKV